jgi:MerR family transcriptional regulator, copper efflux regulator
MDGYSISQVAERTGFTTSALRFYEQQGLVRPARTAAGYRSYDDRDLEALRFVRRAKRLGLALDAIDELLGLLDDDRCAAVQPRLRQVIDSKLAEARSTMDDLAGLSAELERVASTLAAHTADGPCDDGCGCLTDAEPPSELLACTLEPGEIGDRIARWQAAVGEAISRESTRGAVRLRFRGDVDVGALAALAAAEQRCCGFFRFRLDLDADGVSLEVAGPDDAVAALLAEDRR